MKDIKKMFADENTRPQTMFIGQNLITYDTIDSTNIAAKKNISLPNGTIFVAKEQTSGRGRQNRSWESNDSGLWFSVILKPDIQKESISQITLISGLAVCEAIGYRAKIKWPNDIVIGTKKVCGILCELYKDTVILGIGINVSDFPAELSYKATSLENEGIHITKAQLLKNIAEKFETYYTGFLEKGFIQFKDLYRNKCVNIGKEVLIFEKNIKTQAKAIDISDNGALVINENGEIREVFSGEVSIRGFYGYI